jgi:endoglucanase
MIALPLSADGRFIVDATGSRVRLAGVNWFGAHCDDGVAPGLDRVHRAALAETIAGLGFNSVRFPFSLWMLQQTAAVPDRYLAANPDLRGSTPLQVFDACVAALTAAGLIVIPNCHLLDRGWCCSNYDTNGLWFNDSWTAAQFTRGWRTIATRYRANRLVAAMDIKNEPRQATVGGRVLKPSWGDGGATDFAAMYAATGDAIHQIDPDVLIICDGLSYAADLTGVASRPVVLSRPGKIVYGMHDYPWFHPAGQDRQAYLAQMDANGGYLLREGIAPVWLGEFGIDPGNEAVREWWDSVYAWLTRTEAGWCWWGLNPVHVRSTVPVTGRHAFDWGDRAGEGILAADWSSVANPAFLEQLQTIMAHG